MSGNNGQAAEFPSHKIMPDNLGVGLGVAARELITTLLGAMESEFTVPPAFSESEVTVLTFFEMFGLYQAPSGSLQQNLVGWNASLFKVLLQKSQVSPDPVPFLPCGCPGSLSPFTGCPLLIILASSLLPASGWVYCIYRAFRFEGKGEII